MKPAPISWLCIAQEIAKVALYNTVIAVFFWITVHTELYRNFIFSQCIGLSIYSLVRLSCRLRGTDKPGLVDGVVGICLGFVLGVVLGSVFNGLDVLEFVLGYPAVLLGGAASALIFGAIATYHFRRETFVQEAKAQAEMERAKRLEQEASATQTELALLQAQIEPHFLFNTLSNVLSLIDNQPDEAKAMLLHLTTFLRTSLARTRRSAATLGQELELLRAYLGIMQIRMGTRLRWHIDCPTPLLTTPLPPLLLQPLVENALQHGLETKPEGGELYIACQVQLNQLLITVRDSGLGFQPGPQSGIGLANVRRRLHACFGEQASLSIAENPEGGVTARLTLPYSEESRP